MERRKPFLRLRRSRREDAGLEEEGRRSSWLRQKGRRSGEALAEPVLEDADLEV